MTRASNLQIIEAKGSHIDFISHNLRGLHLKDISFIDKDPKKVIWECFRGSFIKRTAVLNDIPIAMWGCAGTLLGGRGEPWLFATTHAESVKYSLLRHARTEFELMLSTYGNLRGMVNSECEKACAFLAHFGFDLKEFSNLKPFRFYEGN